MSNSKISISLISPSGILNKDRILLGIQRLEQANFEVNYLESLWEQHRHYAGTKESRAKELIHFLNDKNTDIILYARGGSGSIQLLPFLDIQILDTQNSNTIITGFSDATSLLNHFSTFKNIKPIHGPVLNTLVDCSQEQFDQWVENIKLIHRNGISNIEYQESVPIQNGTTVSPLVGGNLATIASLVGTPWKIHCNNSILFLEDVGEYPYQVERYVNQLHYSNAFEGIKGLILGDFSTKSTHCISTDLLRDIFSDYLPSDIPIISNFPIGHIFRNELLQVGTNYSLNVSSNGINFKQV